MIDNLGSLNGSLGEHIRFSGHDALLIDDFKRTKQVVGGVAGESQCIGPRIDQTMLGCKSVVEAVQLALLERDLLICSVCHLQINQLADTVSQTDHAPDTLHSGLIQIGLCHDRAFAVIDVIIDHRKGVIPDIGVCWDGLADGFTFAKIGKFCCFVVASDILHGMCQLNSKVCSFDRSDGEVLLTVLSADTGLVAQDHFRMINIVAVDSVPIRVRAKVYPVGRDFNGAVALLKKEDIGNDICTSVGLEGVIGQADSAQQFSTLGNVLTHIRRLFVHGVA